MNVSSHACEKNMKNKEPPPFFVCFPAAGFQQVSLKHQYAFSVKRPGMHIKKERNITMNRCSDKATHSAVLLNGSMCFCLFMLESN